jgi:glycosyltransferase involved in cell wall biosynthesis
MDSRSKLKKQTELVARPIKVVCVVDYYLPGFKGGGPIRTIANMIATLSGQVDMAIFTRDRDLGAKNRYGTVVSDTWMDTDAGNIYYASDKMFGYIGLKQALSTHCFDVDLLYLNSFFGFRSSIQMNLWFRRAFPDTPILLAPRGEFSAGALAIKSFKKRLFLALARTFHLYRNVAWHASTCSERDDIIRQFPSAVDNIHVAEDPVSIDVGFDNVLGYRPSPQGNLRIAFISRISPMKNLDWLLQILTSVSSQVELAIFGPIEDLSYWKHCQALISGLPSNVTASYHGTLQPESVSDTFSGYDMFVFPTRGENFGHVIFEALRAGTPVLISDRTSWEADPLGAVSVVPLTDIASWRAHLHSAADKTEDEKLRLHLAARAYAEDFALRTGSADKNIAMFRSVVGASDSCHETQPANSQE